MGFLDSLLNNAQKIAASAANNPKLLGNKSLSYWEGNWRHVGKLTSSFSAYSKYVGVYRVELHGELVYIGRAIEWNNGGFRKRLSDYTRLSDSARTHGSGQKMHLNAADLEISIIITGEDAEAAKIAASLELALIGKYKPPWNVINTGL